jgi:hypothetical protein
VLLSFVGGSHAKYLEDLELDEQLAAKNRARSRCEEGGDDCYSSLKTGEVCVMWPGSVMLIVMIQLRMSI